MRRVALTNLKSYFDDLNSGRLSYNDSTSFATPDVLKDHLTDDVIKNKSKRNKIYPIVTEEIEILTQNRKTADYHLQNAPLMLRHLWKK